LQKLISDAGGPVRKSEQSQIVNFPGRDSKSNSVVIRGNKTMVEEIIKGIKAKVEGFEQKEQKRAGKGKKSIQGESSGTKLEELKKFSESFSLKTAVPQDLLPILTKDKAKQAEILEKAKQASLKPGGPASSTFTASQASQGAQQGASSKMISSIQSAQSETVRSLGYGCGE
jgi:hypothetical protein